MLRLHEETGPSLDMRLEVIDPEVNQFFGVH